MIPQSLPKNNAGTDGEDDSDYEAETTTPKHVNMSAGARALRLWLNKALKIQMTDGRVLIGVFVCTDQDANVILSSCSEFLPADPNIPNEEPRMLGLVMIPGKHIVSVHIDINEYSNLDLSVPLPKSMYEEDLT
ncbi:N-alpha-acetyltransferase 38, NatC auxiliary subunit [Cylas formicarius]|uniref:N-alpha-acetyltransferase 38, NatC auxiliary subunit n=1 Tax=Cylas formicarius TaxID=197179 RepID=UPI0029586C5A|nr:N-alpha-acetyltransferase 38, NatC auxiliary subunit [Cylas formicarius]